MIRGFFEKLHNFRLLPIFVIVSMVIGIVIGKWYGISNFALTPPIDATLEYAVEFIEDDELVEITPKSIRLRKRFLTEHERKRAGR